MAWSPDLSIVIPALREEKRIGKTLDELTKFLRTNPRMKKLDVEVVLVAADGGDKTVAVAKKHAKKLPMFRVVKPGRPVGKGRDVRDGMLSAKGNSVIFMDADLATPLKYLPKVYKKIKDGADVAIGTRNLRTHHNSIIRRMLSNAGNLAFRLLGGVWVEDSQCGFKMFTQEASQLCFSKLTILRWGFDMEVLAIAKQNDLKIASVRVDDWEHMAGGTFDGKVIQNAKQTLGDLAVIFRNRIKGVYKS